MMIHKRGNQYNDDPQAQESVHLDANDVAPICPIILLHSRGNQYKKDPLSRKSVNLDANDVALICQIISLYITNDFAWLGKWIRKPLTCQTMSLGSRELEHAY